MAVAESPQRRPRQQGTSLMAAGPPRGWRQQGTKIQMKAQLFPLLLLILLLLPGMLWAAPKSSCDKETVLQFNRPPGKVPLWRLKDKPGYFFVAGMAISAHGTPNGYDPQDKKGLDRLAKAGRKGNWWSIATDNGKPDGKPLLQKTGPYKGFYISQTSLRDNTRKNDDITQYVDATLIPYIALPPQLARALKVQLGDMAIVVNAANGKLSFAIFADVGARDSLGEGSIALGNLLDLPTTDLRSGKSGARKNIIYLIFPGTVDLPPWPRSFESMNREAQQAFKGWGGLKQLKACFPM